MNGRTPQQLRAYLSENFSLPELRQLAFELEIDHEELAGANKSDFILSLIKYVQRHRTLQQLESAARQAKAQRTAVGDKPFVNKSNFGTKIGILGIVVTVLGIIVTLVSFVPGCLNGTEDDVTPSPANEILLQVRVVDNESQTAVSNAKVSLSIADELFPQVRTDSNGVAVFRLSASTNGEIARITVEANEQVKDQTITVKPGMSAVEFQIQE